MSVRASAVLADEGVHRRVVDLRWLMPLPIDEMAGEGIVTALVENGFGEPQRLRATGCAAKTVLLGKDDIERAVRLLLS